MEFTVSPDFSDFMISIKNRSTQDQIMYLSIFVDSTDEELKLLKNIIQKYWKIHIFMMLDLICIYLKIKIMETALCSLEPNGKKIAFM